MGIVFISLGIIFFTTMGVALGIVFLSIGGMFFVMALNKKKKDKK